MSMQVYSRSYVRQYFSKIFNTVLYGGQVVGVGNGKMKGKDGLFPEVLIVRMPSPEDIELMKISPLGFQEALKKWMLEKISKELGDGGL